MVGAGLFGRALPAEGGVELVTEGAPQLEEDSGVDFDCSHYLPLLLRASVDGKEILMYQQKHHRAHGL